LPRQIIIPQVMKLATLADVRALMQHLPDGHRQRNLDYEDEPGRRSAAKLLSKDEASPAAANGGESERQSSTSKARQQRIIIGTPRTRLGAHEV
jgi:hypothetical protein